MSCFESGKVSLTDTCDLNQAGLESSRAPLWDCAVLLLNVMSTLMFTNHTRCVLRLKRIKSHRLTTNRADPGVKLVGQISETSLKKFYDLGET